MSHAKSVTFDATEGERAIKNLNTLCNSIGYRTEGFKFGSSFEMFLQNNPGCVEAIHNWMAENFDSEQLQDLGFIPGDDDV